MNKNKNLNYLKKDFLLKVYNFLNFTKFRFPISEICVLESGEIMYENHPSFMKTIYLKTDRTCWCETPKHLLTNFNDTFNNQHTAFSVLNLRIIYTGLLSASQETDVGEDCPCWPPAIAEVYSPVFSISRVMKGYQQLENIIFSGVANVSVWIIVPSVLPFPRVSPVVTRPLPGHWHGLLSLTTFILTNVHQRVSQVLPRVFYQQLCQEISQLI